MFHRQSNTEKATGKKTKSVSMATEMFSTLCGIANQIAVSSVFVAERNPTNPKSVRWLFFARSRSLASNSNSVVAQSAFEEKNFVAMRDVFLFCLSNPCHVGFQMCCRIIVVEIEMLPSGKQQRSVSILIKIKAQSSVFNPISFLFFH